MKRRALGSVLALLLLSSSVLAVADDSKISPDLRGYNSTQPVQVIVQYSQPPAQNTLSLGSLLGFVFNILEQLPLINAVVAQVDGTGLTQLSNDSNVVYISPDRPVAMLLSNAAPAINAPTAWKSGYTGSGIGVAVIDSGISNSADLDMGILPLSRVVYSQDFVSGSFAANDAYGHGTHVAGLIAGDGLQSRGLAYYRTFEGIAPAAKLVNLRVLDANGAGTDSRVIAAISKAISLKSTYNIRVINLSLGRQVLESYRQDPLCQAVEKAWKAGIVVVVSAGNYGRVNVIGNEGYGTITSPGNDPYVITVGAMKPMGTPQRTDDLIASYSSKGPTAIDHIVKPDIVAPGNLLVSLGTNGTLASEFPANKVPYSYYVRGGSSAAGPYFTLSGTSMAAGVVSGAVADLLQAHPGLTPDQVKAGLMKTAYKTFPRYSSVTDPATGITYTDQYDMFTVGAGYIDLAAALANTTYPSGSAASPTAAYDPNTAKVYLVKNSSEIWGSTTAWMPAVVWGPSVFVSSTSAMWGSSALWGTSAMWGASNTSAFSALWGTSGLWGSSAMWGSSALWGAGSDSAQSISGNGEK